MQAKLQPELVILFTAALIHCSNYILAENINCKHRPKGKIVYEFEVIPRDRSYDKLICKNIYSWYAISIYWLKRKLVGVM